MIDELIAGLQESADTLRELRECRRQRDELLAALQEMLLEHGVIFNSDDTETDCLCVVCQRARDVLGKKS